MSEPKSSKKANPVYLNVLKLQELLRIVSEHATKNSLDASYFQAYGFSGSDASLAISSLRFLGLIDDQGKATTLMSKIQMRSEDSRKKGFEEVVRKAYSNIFELDKPYDLPSAKLFDEMRGQYGISPRLAGAAVRAFLKLCEYAGLKEGSPTKSPSAKPKAQSKPRKKPPASVSQSTHTPTHHSGLTIIEIAKGKAAIGIREGLDKRALLDKDFRAHLDAFIEAAKKFADTIKDETSDSKEAEES